MSPWYELAFEVEEAKEKQQAEMKADFFQKAYEAIYKIHALVDGYGAIMVRMNMKKGAQFKSLGQQFGHYKEVIPDEVEQHEAVRAAWASGQLSLR